MSITQFMFSQKLKTEKFVCTVQVKSWKLMPDYLNVFFDDIPFLVMLKNITTVSLLQRRESKYLNSWLSHWLLQKFDRLSKNTLKKDHSWRQTKLWIVNCFTALKITKNWLKTMKGSKAEFQNFEEAKRLDRPCWIWSICYRPIDKLTSPIHP